MIQAEHITKTFHGFKALDDMSLHVPKGTIYGLVGPNGAGKSTLIRHLTGIYRPDCGSILIDGLPVYDNPEAKAKFTYIPDDLFYFLQADTLEMKRFYQGIYQKFDTALFDRLQEFFPTIDTRRNIRRLSKGMQKQVAFWLSICAMPELMILDEPMDGLDPVMRRQIWSIILSKASENKTTILISSHNLRELEDVCDHVGIMHKGRIIVERSLSDLQGNVSKIQVAFQEGMPTLPPDFEILHMSNTGRVYTLIVKGDPERAKAILEATHPMLIDILPLTLEEISGSVNMSPKYFCRFFHEMTHRTPIDYLNYYRIERACYQLITTNLSITEIAYASGFNDLSYFIKTFKKYKGTTPKKYLKI